MPRTLLQVVPILSKPMCVCLSVQWAQRQTGACVRQDCTRADARGGAAHCVRMRRTCLPELECALLPESGAGGAHEGDQGRAPDLELQQLGDGYEGLTAVVTRFVIFMPYSRT